MPSATDLIVKNGADVDKTFTLLSPAPGYGEPAEWALKEGVISSVFPRFTASARTSKRPNSAAAAKTVQVKLRVPSSYTDSVTGRTLVGSAFEFNGTATVPNDFPELLKPDAAAFVANIIGHALIREMVANGLPAT